jgi:DNA-directed RNA polymerase specialized sigma24 family protein
MKLRRRDSICRLTKGKGKTVSHSQNGYLIRSQVQKGVCSGAKARDQLVEDVRQLSPKLRTTLQLRDIDGLTTKEAALVLGIPQKTVKAQLARARAKLARIAHLKPIRRRARTVS